MPVSSLSRSLSVLAVAGAVVFATSQVRADEGGCKAVSGPFTARTVPVPPCTSPVGLCTSGHLGGELDGDYDFTASALYPHPTIPGALFAEGESVITTKKGIIRSHDFSTVIPVGPPTVPYPLETVINIYDGTKHYAKRTGSLVATGTITFATGEVAGAYSGTICKDKKDKDDDD